MKFKEIALGVAFLCLPLLGIGLCQESSPVSINHQDQDKQEDVLEFAERYERMFASRDPKLGATIENVSAYDESGDTFELKSTRGKHTVLVFGCLT